MMHERCETRSCVSKKKESNCRIEDLRKSQGIMNWSFEDGCLGDRCYATVIMALSRTRQAVGEGDQTVVRRGKTLK
jgi:hypothetical protein